MPSAQAALRHSPKPSLAALGTQSEAKEACELRVALWRRCFGAATPRRAARALLSEAVLKRPAVAATWKAIQERAESNEKAYNVAFWYTPRSEARPEIQPKEAADNEPGGAPASIWPTWKYQTYMNHAQGGRLQYRMPFDPLFWRAAEHGEVSNSWAPAPGARGSLAPSAAPEGIRGFIVALPTEWTRSEDNLYSKTHIMTIAANPLDREGGAQLAAVPASASTSAGQPA